MFGNNPVRSSEAHLSGSTLRIQEIFYTLQGEGPLSGMPCTFIRLAGCNLRCHFCDTQFDSNWDNVLTIPHILKAMDFETGYKPKAHELVVITGGEPMLQNLQPLIQALLLAGTKLVQIESAGTLWQEDLKDYVEQGKVLLVCSPKTPKLHPDFVRHCHHFKYVVKRNECSAVDGLPTFSTQKAGAITQLYRPAKGSGTTIWISPCDEHDTEKNLLNMIYARDLCLEHGHRLSLQTHKIVNVR